MTREAMLGGMATQDDVRRIALSFPGAREGEGQFGFSVLDRGKEKGFCWVWSRTTTASRRSWCGCR